MTLSVLSYMGQILMSMMSSSMTDTNTTMMAATVNPSNIYPIPAPGSDGYWGGSPETIYDPTIVCLSGATAFDFVVTETLCGNMTIGCQDYGAIGLQSSEVYIDIFNEFQTLFSSKVTLGETFRLKGPFEGDLRAILFSVVTSGTGEQAVESRGDMLQMLQGIELDCEGISGVLRDPPTSFGALDLVRFINPSQINVRAIVEPVALHNGTEWEDADAYQTSAITWLETQDSFSWDLPVERVIQRYVLACIYHATTIKSESRMLGWVNMAGWLSGSNECSWWGITCNTKNEVEKIELRSNNILRSFPEEITILASSITHLDLTENPVSNSGKDGHGWLKKLTNLKVLKYGRTGFAYNGIPPYLSKLTKLVMYDCSYSYISGEIVGAQFANLTKLGMFQRDTTAMCGSFASCSIALDGFLPSTLRLQNRVLAHKREYVQYFYPDRDWGASQPQ